jgi:hypothetical protein
MDEKDGDLAVAAAATSACSGQGRCLLARKWYHCPFGQKYFLLCRTGSGYTVRIRPTVRRPSPDWPPVLASLQIRAGPARYDDGAATTFHRGRGLSTPQQRAAESGDCGYGTDVLSSGQRNSTGGSAVPACRRHPDPGLPARRPDGSGHDPTASPVRRLISRHSIQNFLPEIRHTLAYTLYGEGYFLGWQVREPTVGVGFHTGKGLRIPPPSGEVVHRVRSRSRCGRRSCAAAPDAARP